jgi:hypothetical protein
MPDPTTPAATAHPPVQPGGRRRTRGRRFGWFTLAVAVLAAGTLGVSAFGALAMVDLGSLHPFEATMGWLTLFAVALAAALVGVLLSVVALFACHPRAVALTALVASLALPVLSVWLATGAGVATLKANIAHDLTTDMRVVGRTLDALETWQVDVSPVRALLPASPEAR